MSSAHIDTFARDGLPAPELQTNFCAITRMGDIVTFGLEVEKLGSRSLVLLLDCKADSEERLRARQDIVTTSLDTHRATEVPADLHVAIERFRDAFGSQ
jgi:4-hydroxybenzoyl-CoA thioesterase